MVDVKNSYLNHMALKYESRPQVLFLAPLSSWTLSILAEGTLNPHSRSRNNTVIARLRGCLVQANIHIHEPFICEPPSGGVL
jgi:hypothetical protein